jgi:hypothetical protein
MSILGSVSHVFSIEENPVYEQLSQSVQSVHVLQDGVQTGGKIQLLAAAVGVGVGVGVNSIIVEHSWI